LWYHAYELNHAAMQPLRWAAGTGARMFSHPFNPVTYTGVGRTLYAACSVFDQLTQRYGKPRFDITETHLPNGQQVSVTEEVVWRSPWVELKHFRKSEAQDDFFRAHRQPPVLVVAPMSGHYATLLRGTVNALLPAHDVYITDWQDARHVPILHGRFGLAEYIDTLIAIMRGPLPRAHVVAVCQPGPPSLAATALLAEARDPAAPLTLTVMGSPIDARRSPTEPNRLAEARPLDWFRNNLISSVPWPYTGAFREVYPGFMQLAGFIDMNKARHVGAYWDYFNNLVEGDGDSAERHRTFYDEFLAVMDLTAEFYLQTIDAVFQRHLLAKGELRHRGQFVRPDAIRGTALFTVEGELDDISGIGQTQAAHDLTPGIRSSMKLDHVQKGVGHYGVFNGSRFRREIAPRIAGFIRAHDTGEGAKILPFTKSAERRAS
jgi:poly(3-hydroxybutyrate) depolymerase